MAVSTVSSDAKALFGIALALIGFAVLIDIEAIAWLIGPVVVVLLLVAMTKVPLRVSLLTLMFCALTLENPAEVPAAGVWGSPLYPVGGLLLNHMNQTTGVKIMFMSGMDIALISLLLIGLRRESAKARIDRAGRVATPRPLVKLAQVSLAGTAFVLISGAIRGGDMGIALWQMDRVVYLPLVFYLFHLGLRGPADLIALGKVILAAATFRAIAATYIIHTFYVPKDENGIIQILPYATTHHDSVLFASGILVLFALAFTRALGKKHRYIWAAVPIIMLGMVSNHRRMVWVQVLLVPVALYLFTPTNRYKKKAQRIALMCAPFVTMYALAGWNSGSSLFKPVRIMRTVVDSKADNSTLWREIENFDLISTIRDNPLFGTGYGRPYNEVVTLPAVDYPLEKFLPHNSILGMLSYSGYFGFAAMSLLWAAGAFFAMRAYYAAKDAFDRAAALSCFGIVQVYLVQCWGDLGLGSWTGVFLIAPAIATAGKLTVALGAWQDKKPKADLPGRDSEVSSA